jgi:hypothetical protein
MEKHSKIRSLASENSVEPIPGKLAGSATVIRFFESKETTDSTLRKLRSCFAADLYVDGLFGKTYHFPMAGAEVNVDEVDYEFLLAKRIKNSSCCGQGGTENPLFEKV